MNKLLGNLNEGLLFVVSAPAGTGKNTLVNLLKSEFLCVEETVSCTTRAKRDGEKEGVEYYFVSQEEFAEKVKEDAFLEQKTVFSEKYGTLKSEVTKIQKEGKHAICVIDVQGALEIKKQKEAVLIFILPPSLKELEKRLKKRKTETDEEIQKRLGKAKQEMAQVAHYNYAFVNDDLDQAYQVLRSIFIAEEHKIQHLKKAQL